MHLINGIKSILCQRRSVFTVKKKRGKKMPRSSQSLPAKMHLSKLENWLAVPKWKAFFLANDKWRHIYTKWSDYGFAKWIKLCSFCFIPFYFLCLCLTIYRYVTFIYVQKVFTKNYPTAICTVYVWEIASNNRTFQ